MGVLPSGTRNSIVSSATASFGPWNPTVQIKKKLKIERMKVVAILFMSLSLALATASTDDKPSEREVRVPGN